MNNQKRILDFFALTPIMFGLLAMVIFIGLGEKMAERFLPIYLIALGGGSIIIGLLNGLDNLLSALYSLLGGFLSDRIGAKRSLLIFNLLSLAGFLIESLGHIPLKNETFETENHRYVISSASPTRIEKIFIQST